MTRRVFSGARGGGLTGSGVTAGPSRVVRKVVDCCGGDVSRVRVGLLGLAFKGTGDLPNSPALAVARMLSDRGRATARLRPRVRAVVRGGADSVRRGSEPGRRGC